MPAIVTLDGLSLSIADVVAVARHGAPVAIAPHALAAVTASRRTIEAAAARAPGPRDDRRRRGRRRAPGRSAATHHARGERGAGVRERDAGADGDGGAARARCLGAVAHRACGGGDEPRGGAGYPRAVRSADPRRAPPPASATLGGPAARARRRFGHPRGAP